MTESALSLYAFSIYELISGLLFIFCPNLVFGLLKIPKTEEVWIRFVGIMALIVGFYNYQIATMELTEMYAATMYARAAFMLFILMVVVFKKQPKILLLFALVDVVAMIWMYQVW